MRKIIITSIAYFGVVIPQAFASNAVHPSPKVDAPSLVLVGSSIVFAAYDKFKKHKK